MAKDKKEKKTKTRSYDSKPTLVDLTRSDCYELCFDVDEENYRIFTGKINERLLVERYNPLADNKKEFDECTVLGFDERDGTIQFWDEVRGQFYYVDLYGKDLPYVLRVTKQLKIKRQYKQKNEETPNLTQENTTTENICPTSIYSEKFPEVYEA